MPGSCYAQAYIRQGKFLWNYGVKIDDDFDDIRKELKTLDIESIVDTIIDQQNSEIKLMVNEEVYKQQQELVVSNDSVIKTEEVGNYNVKFDRIEECNNQLKPIPPSKLNRKLISVSLSDDEDEKSSQNDSDEEESSLGVVEDSENKVIVKSTKKCKKAYSQLTKSILRGIQLGIKKGIKEAIETIDFSFFDQTNKAVAFVSGQ